MARALLLPGKEDSQRTLQSLGTLTGVLRMLMRDWRLESKNLYFMNKNYFCKERRPKRPFPRDHN